MDALRGNFDKVVQHGKRADGIVKNMLQHSREGSGEHRPVDVNTLVEESLISPGTEHGPRSRALRSHSRNPLTPLLGRSMSSRRTSGGHC